MESYLPPGDQTTYEDEGRVEFQSRRAGAFCQRTYTRKHDLSYQFCLMMTEPCSWNVSKSFPILGWYQRTLFYNLSKCKGVGTSKGTNRIWGSYPSPSSGQLHSWYDLLIFLSPPPPKTCTKLHKYAAITAIFHFQKCQCYKPSFVSMHGVR